MNKIFKKEKVITLDKFYHLTTDGANGVQLVLTEIRERKKKDSDEKENFVYTESLYFTRVNQALNRYVEMTQNNFDSLEDLISKTDKIYKVISDFDAKFKQFE